MLRVAYARPTRCTLHTWEMAHDMIKYKNETARRTDTSTKYFWYFELELKSDNRVTTTRETTKTMSKLNHNGESAKTEALREKMELDALANAEASKAFLSAVAGLKLSVSEDRLEFQRQMKGRVADTPPPVKDKHVPHLGGAGGGGEKRTGDMGCFSDLFTHQKLLKPLKAKEEDESYYGSYAYDGSCAYDSYGKGAYDPDAKDAETDGVVEAMCSPGGESTPGASTPSTEVESCGGTEDNILDKKT
jgi:hypothetical protein